MWGWLGMAIWYQVMEEVAGKFEPGIACHVMN